jgi:predicted RNA binding protein YcfA (HicA-like mRNA interferase family)
MKLPRDLSGEELVKHLSKRGGYVKIHQVGSHIILQTQHPTPHRIAVPEHTPLRVGTLHKSVSKEAILKDI